MKKIKFSWSAYSAVAILLLWLVSSAQARIPQNAETFSIKSAWELCLTPDSKKQLFTS
jgi:hypothetical protein